MRSIITHNSHGSLNVFIVTIMDLDPTFFKSFLGAYMKKSRIVFPFL